MPDLNEMRIKMKGLDKLTPEQQQVHGIVNAFLEHAASNNMLLVKTDQMIAGGENAFYDQMEAISRAKHSFIDDKEYENYHPILGTRTKI